jgi:isoquinoline 1-oxidoreductase subunit beta
MHKNFENLSNVDRRDFLKTSVVAGGALVVAFHTPVKSGRALAAATNTAVDEKFPPNAFVKIEPDNSITIQINKLEMGQGVNTSMAQLIAEELDADWNLVKAESAPVNAVFNHTAFGTQMTGGSSALISSYDQHRKIGATMRAMLMQAAANQWNVPLESIKTENSFVIHAEKGKLSYGSLAGAAAKIQPKNITLKDPKDFKIIGKSMKRLDAVDKSSGKAIFGSDVKLPGMLYAMVVRAPVFGAKLKSYDASEAKKIAGVVDVVKLPNSVAVLAKNTYSAILGQQAIKAEWDTKGNEKLSSESILNSYRELAKKKGAVAKDEGNVVNVFATAGNQLEAEYHFPYLAHACMEPMNCTINFDGKTAEIWSGHQMPTVDRDTAASILFPGLIGTAANAIGLAPATVGAVKGFVGLGNEKVKVHTTYAGGSFGRRANKNCDYVVEAAQLAKIVKKPLKIFWSREDDTKAGYYRPFTYHRARIAFDDKGMPSAWDHSIVGQSVVGDSFFEKMMVKNGVDPTVVEGVADTHYAVPNKHVEVHLPKQPVPVLWWRSVGHTHTAYVMETLIDEIATNAKKDALKIRKEMLAKSVRHMAVLDLLEKKSPWGKKAPNGRAYGLAVHESFQSVVGQVAEVSYQDGKIQVHKVWCAVDCGLVVNPDGAKSQIEGGIVYGLSAALYGKIDIQGGAAQSSNFHDYPVMRMEEMPKVEVFFVEGGEKPTGLGEPGTPPIAPAVANALFQLTGKRIRSLPFSEAFKS